MLTKIFVGIGLIAIQFALDQLVRRIESGRMAISPKVGKQIQVSQRYYPYIADVIGLFLPG